MPLAIALGFQYDHIHDGTCTTRLTWRPEHSHAPGVFQASPIGALADFTGASAAMSTQPTRTPALALDYTLKLLAEARGDTLTAHGRVLRAGSATVGIVDLHALTATTRIHCATALVTTDCSLLSPDNPTPGSAQTSHAAPSHMSEAHSFKA
jgi:uncharacterized protein (TIGR00369 family)